MVEYFKSLISAESEKDAKEILKFLTMKKLVAGGMISNDPAMFWWKGEIVEMKYYNISVFTISDNLERIIKEVEKMSKEEVPIITFFKIDSASEKFLNWISDSIK